MILLYIALPVYPSCIIFLQSIPFSCPLYTSLHCILLYYTMYPSLVLYTPLIHSISFTRTLYPSYPLYTTFLLSRHLSNTLYHASPLDTLLHAVPLSRCTTLLHCITFFTICLFPLFDTHILHFAPFLSSISQSYTVKRVKERH